jgi:hypothetical protein
MSIVDIRAGAVACLSKFVPASINAVERNSLVPSGAGAIYTIDTSLHVTCGEQRSLAWAGQPPAARAQQSPAAPPKGVTKGVHADVWWCTQGKGAAIGTHL